MEISKISDAVSIQEEFAKRVIRQDQLPPQIKNVCGIDVAYRDNIAFCSAVIVDYESLQIVESAENTIAVKNPYVSGFFMLRESEPIFSTIRLLKNQIDLLILDGHGISHPRRCGLASYIGVSLDIPTIGVAKNLLCGSERDDMIILDEETVGQILYFKNKKIYVSIGNKVSLPTATKLTKHLIKQKNSYPEPLRIADQYSKQIKNIMNLSTKSKSKL